MSDPSVFLAGAHSLLWHRKIGIGERAHRHANEIGHAPRLPIEIGTAAAAEMKQHWIAARRRPLPCTRSRAITANIRARIERRHAERASRAPLAIAAMTERDFRWRPFADERERAAMAGSSASFHICCSPFCILSGAQRSFAVAQCG